MKSKRAELVAEAAIAILADQGMRGLTHRAVDEAANLPTGSTSNLARTRSALLELALARLTELEAEHFAAALSGEAPRPDDLAGVVELMAAGLRAQYTVHRRRTLARYELALEATRRPELRAIYDEVGALFRDPAVAIIAAVGSTDPVRHGRQIIAYSEGVLFDVIAGAGDEPSLDDLRLGFKELLRGMLGPRPGLD
jgi:DNA-binding transcriptional regulator YbjK